MGKVEKIVEEIMQDEKEVKQLISKESIDDLYEFFLEKDNTLTMEEFDNEVYDILENYSKTSKEEIDQDTLEKISGGKAGFLKKTAATALSALTISPVSAVEAGNNGAINGPYSIVRSAKDKFNHTFRDIAKWLSANKKTVATIGGAVGAAAVGAIILSVVLSKRKNAGSTDSSSASQELVAQSAINSSSSSLTTTVNSSNAEQTANGGNGVSASDELLRKDDKGGNTSGSGTCRRRNPRVYA